MRLCFVILILINLGCTSPNPKSYKLISYVPETASCIVKIKDLEKLKENLRNNDFLDQFSKTKAYKNLAQKLLFTQELNFQSPILIALGQSDISIISRYHDKLFPQKSIWTTITQKREHIREIDFRGTKLYATIVDSSVCIISTSRRNIVNVNQVSPDQLILDKLNSATDADSEFSVLIKPTSSFLKTLWPECFGQFDVLNSYFALDFEMDQNKITFNGVLKPRDSSYTSCYSGFKNSVPQTHKIQTIVPADSDGFASLSAQGLKGFQADSLRVVHRDSMMVATAFLESTNELGLIYKDNDKVLAIRTMDSYLPQEVPWGISQKTAPYRGVDIVTISKPRFFLESLASLIDTQKFTAYCKLGDFYVFSDKRELLEDIIDSYQNNTTFSSQIYYRNMALDLSTQSSLLLVAGGQLLKNILIENNSEFSSISLNNYKVAALQFVYEDGIAYVNGSLLKHQKKRVEQSVSKVFDIKLNEPLLNAPQFVKNHITGEKEIVIQDIYNNLYLIGNTGKILWKKRLQGAVLGSIQQIDIYKNGRLQLVFVTPYRLYVVDRKGRDVGVFPKLFKDEITQPLAVFDYANTKTYRLLVTQEDELLMYNAQGARVVGFTFEQAQGDIIHQPQHFRIHGKDYIAVKTKNKFYILNRRGQERIIPKTQTNYSSEAIYLYKNKFTTTTATGKLVQIGTTGKVEFQNLGLSKRHHICASSRTLVTQNENKLSIRSKTKTLDFGDYTPPELFFLKNKIYIATTDLQTHKVYLFDSQARLLPGFPIYGNSQIELDNIDADTALELITRGDSNNLILYKVL